MTGERSRKAPSRHDRGGVKRRRQRANAEQERLGLYLSVPQRGGGAQSTFSAHTRKTLPAERTSRGGVSARRPTATDLAWVHVLCKCGEYEVRIRADIAASGAIPRCSMACDALAVKREAAEKRLALKADRELLESADPLIRRVARTLRRRRG